MTTLELIDRLIDESCKKNYYFDEQGTLVYLDNQVGDELYHVQDVFYFERDFGEYPMSAPVGELGYKPTRIYKGILYKYAEYGVTPIQHDMLTSYQKKLEELKTEVEELRSVHGDLKRFQDMQRADVEDSKIFMMMYDLMRNTKRYILVRAENYCVYVIDNADKKQIPSREVEHNYDDFNINHRFDDIEFTIVREFNNSGKQQHLDNNQFKYRMRLKRSYDRDSAAYKNEPIVMANGGDITFHDTLDEVMETINDYLQADLINPNYYLRLCGLCNREPHPKAIDKLREHVAKRIETSIKNSQSFVESSIRSIEENKATLEQLSNITSLEEMVKAYG